MRRVPFIGGFEETLVRLVSRAVLYVSVIAAGVMTVGLGVERFLASILDAPPARVASAVAADTIIRTGQLQPTQDSWVDQLRDPAYWAARRGGGSARPANKSGPFWGFVPAFPPLVRYNLGVFSAPPPAEVPAPRRGDQSTFRTVCVRLCDGAFFPLSFSTTKDNFAADADRCSQSCGMQARLFVYKNPGSEIEDMEDLDGRPYRKLTTAFRYKTTYDEACKCRPHPWEEASTTRHKVYALEAAQAKGSKTADVELKDLRAKMRKAESDAAADKVRLAQAKIDEQKQLAEAAKTAKAAARLAAKGRPAKADDASRAVEAKAPVVAAADSGATKRRTSTAAPPNRQASLPGEPGVVIMRLGTSTTFVRVYNQSRPASATR